MIRLLFSFLLVGFSSHAKMQGFTDLGPIGNQSVAERFQRYQETHSGCRTQQSGPRVILTGFGLFSGVPANFSGALVSNLANPKFWPSQSEAPVWSNDYEPLKGILATSDNGARITNRTFSIRGQTVSVCLITLDVWWDLAGLIIANEMDRFQPNVVIMSGLGGYEAVIEAGALNNAMGMAGYDSDGSYNRDLTPVDSVILAGVEESVPMTWDFQKLANRANPEIRNLGYSLATPTEARGENNYICNNVSFIALQAAKSRELKLAGEKVILAPKVKSNPRIGFFHFPAGASLNERDLTGFAKVVMGLIEESIF